MVVIAFTRLFDQATLKQALAPVAQQLEQVEAVDQIVVREVSGIQGTPAEIWAVMTDSPAAIVEREAGVIAPTSADRLASALKCT